MKTKTVVTLLSLVFAVFLLSGLSASAEVYSGYCSYSSSDSATWSLDTTTGVLEISGSGAMKNYSSTSSIPWYSYRDYVKSVSIGNGVTSIGNHAFSYCTSLASINIPDNVTSIGDWAFSYCTSLASINIPDSVTSIGSSAFRYCNNLTIYGYANSYAQTYAMNNNIPFVIIGDPNNDGTTNYADVTEIAKAITKNAAYNPAADMNGDGKITLTDLRALVHQLISSR